MVSANEKVRVIFSKTGALKFISHLDISRTMRQALLRGEIPVKYSEGFNPHPRMSIALPLPIGVEGYAEIFDFICSSDVDERDIADRLNAALPGLVRVKEVYAAVKSHTEIGFADYEIEIRSPGATAAIAAEIAELPASPLTIEKKTKAKPGIKTVDISPLIGINRCEVAEYGIFLAVRLSAGSENYLNVLHLTSVLEKRFPALCIGQGENDFVIRRTGILDCDKNPFR